MNNLSVFTHIFNEYIQIKQFYHLKNKYKLIFMFTVSNFLSQNAQHYLIFHIVKVLIKKNLSFN